MALGATKPDIFAWTVRQKMRPVVVGAIAGLVCSIGVSIALRAVLVVPGNPDFLFGTSSFDGMTFTSALSLLASIALIACYVPARRATKVDPMVALRYE